VIWGGKVRGICSADYASVLCRTSICAANIYWKEITEQLTSLYSLNILFACNYQSEPIHFADGSSAIISHLEMDSFKNYMNDIFVSLKKWFKHNKC
jgi:hypothetical protein